MKIRPLGGYGCVTGSCTLLNFGSRYYLVDCGCESQQDDPESKKEIKLPFNPVGLHAIFITHAHYDHFGLLPRIVRNGFRGIVYCTKPTAACIRAVLQDAARSPDAGYSVDDLEQIKFKCLEDIPEFRFGTFYKLDANLSFAAIRTAHVLGSVGFEFQFGVGNRFRKTVVFSGDLGNNTDGHEHQSLLKGRQNPSTHATQIICEATYGGKSRDAKFSSYEYRITAIKDLIESKATSGEPQLVLIPSFALHRMQELLIDLHIAMEQLSHLDCQIPVDIYLDSPLGRELGRIYAEHLFLRREDGKSLYLNPLLRERLGCQDEEELRQLIRALLGAEAGTVKFSNYTLHFNTPRYATPSGLTIVIAASGMCNGGRILGHLRRNVSNPNCHVVLLGYQSNDTPGYQLKEMLENGVKGIGETFLGFPAADVLLHVHDLSGYYSGHADEDGLIDYLLRKDSPKPFADIETVILNHGTQKAREALRDRIVTETKKANEDYRRVKAVITPFASHGWFDCKSNRWLLEYHPQVETVEAAVACCLGRIRRIEKAMAD